MPVNVCRFVFFRPIIYYGGRSKLQREGKKHTVSKAFFERLLFFLMFEITHTAGEETNKTYPGWKRPGDEANIGCLFW